jgi:hypothetical protein
MGYTMKVIETESCREHELPADAVTRDTEGTRAPLIPLGYRPLGDVFFVSSQRWPELIGKPLRRTDT